MKAFKLFLFTMIISCGMTHAFTPRELQNDSSKFKWVKGERYLLHKVLPKETWSSISRKYDMPVSDLMIANAGVIDLKIGQILNVPSTKSIVSTIKKEDTTPAANENPKNKTAILYTVRGSETLFGIAKKFDVSVDQVKKWNNLQSDIVHEGQKLVVNYMSSSENKQEKTKETIAANAADIKKTSVEEKSFEPAITKQEDPKKIAVLEKHPVIDSPIAKNEKANSTVVDIKDNPTRSMIPVGKAGAGKTLMQITESGICSWITDGDVNQNKYYGLHRTAPIGTIIKVTNKMNSRYIFVKIVGVLPDTGDNENDIVKISQAAVNKLGALDAHFQVELSYGMLQ